MYSDSEMVMDALAEMLETLLDKHTEDQNTLNSLSMIQSFIQTQGSPLYQTSSTMKTLEDQVSSESPEREDILCELVAAIGLQRFKMKMHLLDGKTLIFVHIYRRCSYRYLTLYSINYRGLGSMQMSCKDCKVYNSSCTTAFAIRKTTRI